jgi:SNF2 family DNA or RNA helicase
VSTSELRGYQQHGVEWLQQTLHARRAAILADEPGLGKTLQSITALLASGARSIVIICPAIVVPHWWAQLEKWGAIEVERHPRRKGVAWRGRAGHGAQSTAEFRVYSYEGFAQAVKAGGAEPSSKQARWVALPASCDFLVLDELHHLMSENSKRSKAVRQALAEWPQRPAVLGLSGTPMTARPRDLWAPLDLLFGRRVAGSFFNFTKSFCAGHWKEIEGLDRPVWDSSGTSNAAELAAKLAPLMLRRTKQEVLSELPAIQRSVHEVELPEQARRAAGEAAREAFQDTDEWAPESSALTLGRSIGRLLSGLEAHKLDAAAELAQELVAEGSRPLLLTTRIESARLLGERLCCPWVCGETPVNSRREQLLAGTGPGIATIGSVLEGVDLVEFDVVIFVGLDWVPARLLQAESRAHRMGQRRSVQVIYLVCVGTLDELVRDRVIERLETFAAIVGGEAEGELAQTLRGGSEDDLLNAFIEAAKESAA